MGADKHEHDSADNDTAEDKTSLAEEFPNPDDTSFENTYGLNDETIDIVYQALETENNTVLEQVVNDLTAANLANLYEKIDDDARTKLLDSCGDFVPPVFFAEIDPNLRKPALENMSPAYVAGLISELDSDDALDMIQNLEVDFQHEIIKKLSAKTRVTLEEGLNFPEESAGRLMQREVVAVPQFWTAGKTIDYLRAAADDLPSEFFDVFVISPTYRVLGEVPLSRLIKSPRTEKLENLTLDDLHPIPATMDQEDVAQLFRNENLTSVPVVDDDERLIGVITIDDIVDVIDEEAHEDLLRLAGIGADDLYSAILSTTQSRFRWLFVNLLTAILASLVIALFDATIEKVVALAVLMPIVASMGGNAGTQAMTVAVRALAAKDLSRTNASRMIWKETIVGTINGAAFAIIMGIVASLWFGNMMLGGVIASAMIINLIVAGAFGAGIPIILNQMGSDPAVSSAVFLTTITDIVGFFAFLGLAAFFLV